MGVRKTFTKVLQVETDRKDVFIHLFINTLFDLYYRSEAEIDKCRSTKRIRAHHPTRWRIERGSRRYSDGGGRRVLTSVRFACQRTP